MLGPRPRPWGPRRRGGRAEFVGERGRREGGGCVRSGTWWCGIGGFSCEIAGGIGWDQGLRNVAGRQCDQFLKGVPRVTISSKNERVCRRCHEFAARMSENAVRSDDGIYAKGHYLPSLFGFIEVISFGGGHVHQEARSE